MYSVNDGPLFPIDKCTRKASKLDYNFYNLKRKMFNVNKEDPVDKRIHNIF